MSLLSEKHLEITKKIKEIESQKQEAVLYSGKAFAVTGGVCSAIGLELEIENGIVKKITRTYPDVVKTILTSQTQKMWKLIAEPEKRKVTSPADLKKK